MVNPKKWSPTKKVTRPLHEIYWFDGNGDHSYFAEMSPEAARKVSEYLAGKERAGIIHAWNVVEHGAEGDFADAMDALREYFNEG